MPTDRAPDAGMTADPDLAAVGAPVAGDGRRGEVRVWDPVVRLFHWTLVAAFFGAFLINSPRDLHETLGWVAGTAVAVRLAWGFIGTKPARFATFVPTPAGFLRYARAIAQGREQRYLSHNPAGGAMVVALLAIVATLVATGWMMGQDAFWGVDWVETLHEGAANLGLALVALHVAGVVWESRRHGENLVVAMVTGRKRR